MLIGGQAAPAALLARAADHGIRIVRSYGASETSGGCVYDGRPIGTTTVRVVDDEVWLGGPSLAEGYLGDDELTDDRFVMADGARWFRTADAGTWDGTTLAVTGRRDDVIVSGGLKVSLGAIERVLRDQPGFADAVAVRVADDRWGESSVVFTTSAASGIGGGRRDRGGRRRAGCRGPAGAHRPAGRAADARERQGRSDDVGGSGRRLECAGGKAATHRSPRRRAHP